MIILSSISTFLAVLGSGVRISYAPQNAGMLENQALQRFFMPCSECPENSPLYQQLYQLAQKGMIPAGYLQFYAWNHGTKRTKRTKYPQPLQCNGCGLFSFWDKIGTKLDKINAPRQDGTAHSFRSGYKCFLTLPARVALWPSTKPYLKAVTIAS